ncbi:MAG: DivIVA domain-containing protein [Deltaproteobacteria bacterium]|nr:DivIVA domain-containing protein [Deltaproteobacteria bacterium]
MKLTPLDIQQQQFKTALVGGFAQKEVDAYLDLVAAAFEEALHENIALKDQLKLKDAQIAEFEAREKAMKEMMLTAAKVAEELKAAANREAEARLTQAEAQAERVVRAAETRAERTIAEIAELRRQRAQVEGQLRGILEAHSRLLDATSEKTSDDVVDLETASKKRKKKTEDETARIQSLASKSG